MSFTSTRNKKVAVSASQAIKQGISGDGGLFVPQAFHKFSAEELKGLCAMSYCERASLVLSYLLDDYSTEEIKGAVEKAYSQEKFGSANPAPLVKLSENAFSLELWHGPTCAFKDMALQILPHLITLSMQKTNEDKTVVILVATSGDTGKAALEGFKDVDGIKIIVFYPNEGVSNIQKLQMTTQEGENVDVFGINGNFDDAQNGVKAIFTDEKVLELMNENGFVFSSANSINWGRLAPQIVYYISAYCDLVSSGEIAFGEKINFSVPTGNFGNILAAYYAKKMGLPIHKLICASNVNNVLTQFINDGVYDKNRRFFTTISPSMDILISSNLERLLFDLLDCDDVKLKAFMQDLKEKGSYKIDEVLHSKLKEIFYGGFCDDIATKEEISKTFVHQKYVSDTHTAVAIKVYDDYVKQTGDKTKTVIASTANPYKFNKAVLEAITGKNIDKTDEFSLIDELSRLTGLEVPKELATLNEKQVRFNKTFEKNELLWAVTGALNIK